MYDVLIIGAGLLGCFSARELSRFDLNIAILEKSPDICMGMSRANTAIVYAGYDMQPGTIKAEYCTAANADFHLLCEELGVPFKRCGSLMTAFGPNGEKRLLQKLEQGRENRVPGIEIMNPVSAGKLEPNLSPAVTMALYSPTTGVVNPWTLGIAAMHNAIRNGAELYTGNEVKSIYKIDSGYMVETVKCTYEAKNVINCAGVDAARISAMPGDAYFTIDESSAEYLILDKSARGLVNHVIFEEGEDKDGVTIVPTVEGSILIGATEGPVPPEQGATTRRALDFLRTRTKGVLAVFPENLEIRSFAGRRPRANWLINGKKSDRSINSFEIREKPGFPGFIDLIGIKTPGMTCASKIGTHVAGLITERLNNVRLKTDFKPSETAAITLNGLSPDAVNKLVSENPDYGEIICRCEGISRAEVLASIRSNPGARTLGGVKRRCGAGLGRCQGAFCSGRVLELIAEELGKSVYEIEEDIDGSRILSV